MVVNSLLAHMEFLRYSHPKTTSSQLKQYKAQDLAWQASRRLLSYNERHLDFSQLIMSREAQFYHITCVKLKSLSIQARILLVEGCETERAAGDQEISALQRKNSRVFQQPKISNRQLRMPRFMIGPFGVKVFIICSDIDLQMRKAVLEYNQEIFHKNMRHCHETFIKARS